MEDEQWINFNGTIRNLGNKGKSRGINVSMLTKKSDIGRHIEGHFKFLEEEPNLKELEKQNKEQIVNRRADKILETKTNCFTNQMMQFAKEKGIRVELLLTETNLDIYLELWSQFTSIQTIIQRMEKQNKSKEDIKEQEVALKEQIIKKLESQYGKIPLIIIESVDDDILTNYTQDYIDKLVEYSEKIMTDRSLVWKRKKYAKKKSS